MKTLFILLSFLWPAPVRLPAQEADTQPSVAATTGVLDALAVERQLLVAPKTSPVPAPAPSGQPARIYESEDRVVLVQEQHQILELPYVTLPVLFVRETAELVEVGSRAALEQLASVMRTVCVAEPKALFDIEDHTGTEGTPEFNLTLSISRAQRVCDELTQRHGVPANVLTVHGYGAVFAMHPNGGEAERQLDSRVLVVRTR